MDNIFLVAGIISFIFFTAKFLEMRYINEESKPLKLIIRDTLLVYMSTIIGGFTIDQLQPAINETIKATSEVSPMVFLDNPAF
jgi:hypothetical protein